MELHDNAWANPDLLLFHGTNDAAADSILSDGASLDYSRPMLDFGRGFYTTTNREQAVTWGMETALRRGGIGALVTFTIARIELAALESIWFVRNAETSDDLWSLITHCRTTRNAKHARPGFYDIVIGPVALNYRRRIAMPDSDQVSFHSDHALETLNQALRQSITLG